MIGRFWLGVAFILGGFWLGVIRSFGAFGNPRVADGGLIVILLLGFVGLYLVVTAVDGARAEDDRTAGDRPLEAAPELSATPALTTYLEEE